MTADIRPPSSSLDYVRENLRAILQVVVEAVHSSTPCFIVSQFPCRIWSHQSHQPFLRHVRRHVGVHHQRQQFHHQHPRALSRNDLSCIHLPRPYSALASTVLGVRSFLSVEASRLGPELSARSRIWWASEKHQVSATSPMNEGNKSVVEPPNRVVHPPPKVTAGTGHVGNANFTRYMYQHSNTTPHGCTLPCTLV